MPTEKFKEQIIAKFGGEVDYGHQKGSVMWEYHSDGTCICFFAGGNFEVDKNEISYSQWRDFVRKHDFQSRRIEYETKEEARKA